MNFANAFALIANPGGTRSPAESSSPRLALFPPNSAASDRRSSSSGRVYVGATWRPCIQHTGMRAITQQALGGPEVLELVDLPQPEPTPTEVLVRVAAAGVNPVDWKVRLRGGLLGEPPFTVGWDVAGTVEALGFGVTRFAVGDRVFGMPRFPREAAAYAEYVTSPSRQLARIPEGLSDVEAAALPLAGLTAWQALVETADVQPGQRVLVLGAAGGVGHLAVQIAKARGAYVIGTARSAKHGFLAELGADEAVDYSLGPVEEAVGDVDVVLDLVGSEATAPGARDVATRRPLHRRAVGGGPRRRYGRPQGTGCA